jgi:tetratricopeptide (TPR) repeat protein
LFAQSRFVESIPYLERATELDPNLAFAWSWLASAVLNTGGGGDQARFREYWERAYALRDQVSEHERLWLTGNGSYQGHQEKAAETEELWARTYPRDPRPWLGLGTFHSDRGEFEESLDANLRGFELAPRLGLEAAALMKAYIRLDRFAEAKQIAAKHFARGLDDIQVHQLLLQIAWAQGDQDSAAKQIEWFAGKPEESRVVEDQAAQARMLGQLRHSRELLFRAAELARQRNLAGVAARLLAPNADGDALLGSCAPAQKAGTSSPTSLALCGNAAMVERAEKNAAVTSKSYPESTLWKGARLPLIRAAIAFSRGQQATTVDVLRSMQFERAYPFATYLRGLSYLRMKQGNDAAAEFQKIISHKGADWGPLYPLSYVGLARGAALAGDTVRARKAYDEFFTLWKDADGDVPILTQARKEYAALVL